MKVGDTMVGKITRQELAPSLRAELDDVKNYIDATDALRLGEHIANKNNPHNVTKAQVGLGNVDNVKQATKAEFDTLNDAFDLHARQTNPHGLTTTTIGAVPTGRSIVAGTGLSGGGTLTTSRELSLDRSYTDNRYLRRTGGTLTGTISGGSINSRLTHSNGYLEVLPYNSSYDNGWFAEGYFDGSALRFTRRSRYNRETTWLDMYLGRERVHTTGSIRYGTANPSGGQNGDIYIQY